MFCSACGAQIPEGAKFCPRCGAPVGHSAVVGRNQPGRLTPPGGKPGSINFLDFIAYVLSFAGILILQFCDVIAYTYKHTAGYHPGQEWISQGDGPFSLSNRPGTQNNVILILFLLAVVIFLGCSVAKHWRKLSATGVLASAVIYFMVNGSMMEKVYNHSAGHGYRYFPVGMGYLAFILLAIPVLIAFWQDIMKFVAAKRGK